VSPVYLATAKFPKTECYGLTNQIRRAVVSVGSNLVEGCSRDTEPDFRRFVHVALGSAMELRYQLDISRRLHFLAPEDEDLIDRVSSVAKMLNQLATSLWAR